jgi:hypothetical protein
MSSRTWLQAGWRNAGGCIIIIFIFCCVYRHLEGVLDGEVLVDGWTKNEFDRREPENCLQVFGKPLSLCRNHRMARSGLGIGRVWTGCTPPFQLSGSC